MITGQLDLILNTLMLLTFTFAVLTTLKFDGLDFAPWMRRGRAITACVVTALVLMWLLLIFSSYASTMSRNQPRQPHPNDPPPGGWRFQD